MYVKTKGKPHKKLRGNGKVVPVMGTSDTRKKKISLVEKFEKFGSNRKKE